MSAHLYHKLCWNTLTVFVSGKRTLRLFSTQRYWLISNEKSRTLHVLQCSMSSWAAKYSVEVLLGTCKKGPAFNTYYYMNIVTFSKRSSFIVKRMSCNYNWCMLLKLTLSTNRLNYKALLNYANWWRIISRFLIRQIVNRKRNKLRRLLIIYFAPRRASLP